MKKIRQYFDFTIDKIILIIVLLSIIFFPPLTKFIISQQKGDKKTLNLTVKDCKLTVEVADTDIQRAAGLMFRKELKQDEGMLFVFDKPEKPSFWMKNTSIPLSLAYIDENFVIKEIIDLKPYDLTGKAAKDEVLYSLEVNSGWFKKNSIKEGDIIKGIKRE